MESIYERHIQDPTQMIRIVRTARLLIACKGEDRLSEVLTDVANAFGMTRRDLQALVKQLKEEGGIEK